MAIGQIYFIQQFIMGNAQDHYNKLIIVVMWVCAVESHINKSLAEPKGHQLLNIDVQTLKSLHFILNFTYFMRFH